MVGHKPVFDNIDVDMLVACENLDTHMDENTTIVVIAYLVLVACKKYVVHHNETTKDLRHKDLAYIMVDIPSNSSFKN